MKPGNDTVRNLVFCLVILLLATPAIATTDVHIVKYANDGVTVLGERTVNFTWMEQNLPVYGDGVTHYYMQGPVFNDSITNKWNPEENDPALLTKDMGAVKGTDIRDLCDLAGGMSSDDYNITLKATDGMKRNFSYSSVYSPPARAGRMILTWYRADLGYVNGSYTEGMRNVMLADTSTNPWGYHVFGLWDMHEAYPEPFWYYFSPPTQPSAQGLSVKYTSDILIYSKDPVPAPVAAFTAMPVTGTAPLTVTFTDQSTNKPTSWSWNFGDGDSTNATVQSPVHTYATAGTYTVTLTATNAGGSDSETKTGYITVNAPVITPVAAFSGTPTTGTAPLTVTFTDQSTNKPTSWSWNFGDGDSTNSTMQSPIHTYASAGIYTVTLTATNSAGSDDETKSAYISVDAPLPDEWTVSLSGNVNEQLTRVSFEALADGNRLTYNDGVSTWSGIALWRLLARVDDTDPATFNSALAAAGYTVTIAAPDFSAAVSSQLVANNDSWIVADMVNGTALPKESGGKYLWPLKVAGPLTNKQRVGNISAISLTGIPSAPVAAFTGIPTTGTASLTVTFTDQSTNKPTSWSWNFGDGDSTNATVQSPVHTFASAGAYTVTLTATNSLGSDDETKTSYISVNAAPVTPVAAFTGTPTTGTAPLTVRFTDQSANAPTSWSWNFGDGDSTNATVQNPVHTYASAGSYTVTLTATNSAGSDDETKSAYITVNAAPVLDTLFDGTVTLTQGETFTVTAYNNVSGIYTINRTTPLGALDKVATQQGFTYNVTDKKWAADQVLLLDDVGKYIRKQPGYWYAYVNNIYKDGVGNHANGLNVIELADNDQVNFYYAAGVTNPSDPAVVIGNATAAVKIKVDIVGTGPSTDVLFDGMVTLTPGETFTLTAYNNVSGIYTVNRTTPLGALDKVATQQGFTYNVTDKKWAADQVLLLDDVGKYIRKQPGYWYAYVNNVYKDGVGNHANGLNVIELADNDQVNFYYAAGVTNPADPAVVIGNATAAVKIKVDIAGSDIVPEWSLSLKGAKTVTVPQSLFEGGLACPSSGHQVFYSDSDGNVWGGVPLWLLVSMVDDNPDIGPDHYNFNDSVAAKGYSVKVISGDGWDTTLASADIARNDSYIVANTLNGKPLPVNLTNGKLSWPLHLKGDAVFGGQQVGNITSIELTGLPEPETGWTLTLEGDVVDTITQSYFEDAIACHHNVTWTDGSGIVWEGVPLWDLAGAVDDIETTSHYTFNDTRATDGYSIRVSAGDGFNATFTSSDIAHNDGYFLAHKMNGAALTGTSAPLKLVGPSTTSNKQRVGNVVRISLEGLPSYPDGDWQLNLVGKISDTIPQPEFEYWALHHSATYTDSSGNVYTGIPLWRLMGWVDDRIPHGSNGFNDAAATAGYTVIVKGGDGYAKEFSSKDIGKSDTAFILADIMNGASLPKDGTHPPYPLRLVGTGATGGSSVGNVVEIELTDFQTPVEAPKLHIVKYGTDGKSIVKETTVDYYYLEANFDVIGDGVTVYKYQGLTLDPNDLWDPTETKGMNPPKVSNAIMGTRIRDIVSLVGGMDTGTEIQFIASDGYETKLGYNNIYPNPYVQSHQGDAVLAWYADGQYVPQYSAGMRTFFTPDDHVFGQWDMHEALDQKYWHYNWQDGIQYPSAAGTSNQNVIEIRVYSSPETDWQLELDGTDIGGVKSNISKTYLEQALACQFGSQHKAQYTDSKDRAWEGMPLWFFAGFVDDADQHSDAAFNDTLATNGYRVVVTGSDGYSTEIDSRLIIRNSNYIVANSLNGTHIDETDESWPLRLTGANVSGTAIVKKVASIRLMKYGVAAPVAAFEANVTSGTAPLAVKFTDQSTGTPTGWSWDFNNDGIEDSTAQSPEFTYPAAGEYSVNLTVTNAAGRDSEVRVKYITVAEPPVDEWSVALIGNLNEDLSRVAFASLADGNRLTYTDASGTWSGVALWRVLARVDDADPATFNDNLAAAGYTVTIAAPDFSAAVASQLVAKNDTWIVADTLNGEPLPKQISDKNVWPLKVVGTGLIGKQKVGNVSTITLSDFTVAPAAAFTAAPDYLTVRFTDQSANTPTSWSWDFGDGDSTNATAQNPVHTYASAGTYTVTLTASNGAGSDDESKEVTVTAAPVAPIAAFTATPDFLTVRFTDQSANTPTSWLWDFGDGDSTNATAQNPVHTYASAGTYTVKLTVSNSAGSDDESKDVTVTSKPQPVTAAFTANITSGKVPLPVKFMDQSTGSPTEWYWDFGDGKTSRDQNPVHIYTSKKPGQSYTVTLTVLGPGGQDTEVKTKYITVNLASDRPEAEFTANVTEGKSPLTVQFTDQSTGTLTAWYWDFGDGSKSTQQNPVHTFTTKKKEERFSVTLTVVGPGGKEYEKKTHYITVIGSRQR